MRIWSVRSVRNLYVFIQQALRPLIWVRKKKKSPGKKSLLTGKTWRKPQEEPQRTDPSHDRQTKCHKRSKTTTLTWFKPPIRPLWQINEVPVRLWGLILGWDGALFVSKGLFVPETVNMILQMQRRFIQMSPFFMVMVALCRKRRKLLRFADHKQWRGHCFWEETLLFIIASRIISVACLATAGSQESNRHKAPHKTGKFSFVLLDYCLRKLDIKCLRRWRQI